MKKLQMPLERKLIMQEKSSKTKIRKEYSYTVHILRANNDNHEVKSN